MNSKEKIKFLRKVVKKSWIPMCGSAVPLYCTTVALSGFLMKEYLGISYTQFIFYYKNDYGEGNYLSSDFKNLWKIMSYRLYKSPDYLKNIKSRYDKIFSSYNSFYYKIRILNVKKISDKELLSFFVKSGNYIRKEKLIKLSNSYKPSFISKEESDLKKLLLFKGNKLEVKLDKHIYKYYWLKTSYAGSEEVTKKYLINRLRQLNKKKESQINRKKVLSTEKDFQYAKFVNLIVEVADWQDQRKANIFKAIYHTQKLANEIARRINIDTKDLHYLSSSEFLNLKSLEDIKRKEKVLKERRFGCLNWINDKEEIIISGKEFISLEKYYNSTKLFDIFNLTSIKGTIASNGKVTGKVCLCLSIKDISRVKNGNIIVASMTRPEFLIAMKKAAAIITDEGGITSHAAITSRELNIPCIIGTKSATKILKDGDLVEVDANHGIVKILKRG